MAEGQGARSRRGTRRPANPSKPLDHAVGKREAKRTASFRGKWHWMGGTGPSLESSLIQPLWVGGAVVALGWTLWQISLPPPLNHPDWAINQVSVGASALGAYAVAVLAAAALVNLGTGVYTSLVNRFGKEDVTEANMTVIMPVSVAVGIFLGWLVWK